MTADAALTWCETPALVEHEDQQHRALALLFSEQ